MSKYKHILGLYLRNPAFLALSGFFFLALLVSKVSYNFYIFDISEDFFTLLFVVSIWLSFEMGVLLKRQFANFRSSLFPYYRRPHAGVAIFLFFFFMAAVAVWRKGIDVFFIVNLQEYVGITAACMLVYLLIVYVAYLSIGRLVFVSYFVLLLLAGQTTAIIGFLGQSPLLSHVLLGLTFVLGVYFLRRLMTLKEDGFEYSFLLSWSQKTFGGNQSEAGSISRWLSAQLAGSAAGFPAYPRARGIIPRAWHWDRFEKGELLSILILIVAILPGYVYYLKNFVHLFEKGRIYDRSADFYLQPFSNFLVFAIAPVLVAICLNYRKFGYLSYERIKPVGKKDFLRERGLLLTIYFLSAWVLFILIFNIIPNLVLGLHFWQGTVLWLYLAFCGIYGFAILAWIVYMAAISETRWVIANGILLIGLTQTEFMLMPSITAEWLGVHIPLAVGGAIFLTWGAYRKWCEAEG